MYTHLAGQSAHLFYWSLSLNEILGDILSRLLIAFKPFNVTIQYMKLNTKASPTDASSPLPAIDYNLVLYIGGESLSLTNLLMTHAFCDVSFRFSSTRSLKIAYACIFKVFSYDPLTNTSKFESGKTNKMLMRRYAVVQKARDADVFGILVGTLGVGTSNPPPFSHPSRPCHSYNVSSLLSPLDNLSPEAPRFPPQKVLYNFCGQTNTLQTRQLP